MMCVQHQVTAWINSSWLKLLLSTYDIIALSACYVWSLLTILLSYNYGSRQKIETAEGQDTFLDFLMVAEETFDD